MTDQQDLLADEDSGAADFLAALAELASTVTEIATRLEALEVLSMPEGGKDYGDSADDEDEEEEESAEMSEIAALKEQIANLEEEKAKTAFASQHKDLLIGMSEDEASSVFRAHQRAPGGFAALARRIGTSPPSSQIASTPWSARLGEAVPNESASDPQGTRSRQELYDHAKQQAKGDPMKALDIYKQLVSKLH